MSVHTFIKPRTSTRARPPAAVPAGVRYDSVLPMNRCMAVGDTIASTNGMFIAAMEADGRLRVYRSCDAARRQDALWASARSAEGASFFALVQSDGNFCIYCGVDLQRNEGWHWGSQITADGGQFFARLGDDGNFGVYKGSGLHDCQGEVWSSGVTDPVARIDAVSAIDYDLGAARLVQARPSDLYRETVNNSSARIQTSMISGSVTVSDTTGWSDDLAAGVAAPAGYKGAVPVVAGGRVVLSPDASHAFIRNGAATTLKTWGFHAPASVPPRSSMMCLVSATRSAIMVPYVLTGSFTLASGKHVTGSVQGCYTGSNCHDLSVTLTTYDASPTGNYTISRPLTPMPSINGATVAHAIDAGIYY